MAPSFEALQFLERLNLSENQIAKFADAAPIMKAFSIQELALTRNPICDVVSARTRADPAPAPSFAMVTPGFRILFYAPLPSAHTPMCCC